MYTYKELYILFVVVFVAYMGFMAHFRYLIFLTTLSFHESFSFLQNSNIVSSGVIYRHWYVRLGFFSQQRCFCFLQARIHLREEVFMQALLEMLQISDLLLHAIVRFSLRNFGECRANTIELVDHDFEKHFRL